MDLSRSESVEKSPSDFAIIPQILHANREEVKLAISAHLMKMEAILNITEIP